MATAAELMRMAGVQPWQLTLGLGVPALVWAIGLVQDVATAKYWR